MAAKEEDTMLKRNKVFIDIQYWTVAANDTRWLRYLKKCLQRRHQLHKLNQSSLEIIAKVFRHKSICMVWGVMPSLQSLAWEEVRRSSPALVKSEPKQLVEMGVPSHVVGVLAKCD